MALNRVRVKAVAGRIARTSPRGDFIPTDRYITVERTNYIDRLINVHGDVTVEPAAVAPEMDKPAPIEIPKKEAK